MIDEGFVTVGAHLDELTLWKIQKGDYVDFCKLIPCDRVLTEDEQKLEIVIRGGKTYYVPVNEGTSINNFQRWEQAFRVYANIYTRMHPHRSPELIEYNHIIHTISLSFVWDNVYLYDKDFRIHMSNNPERNWGVILQQAWSLCLHNRIGSGNSNFHTSSANPSGSYGKGGKTGEP